MHSVGQSGRNDDREGAAEIAPGEPADPGAVSAPSILAALSDPALVLDREEVVLLANPAAAELFGVSEKDLAGRCVRDFIAQRPLSGASQPGCAGNLAGLVFGGKICRTTGQLLHPPAGAPACEIGAVLTPILVSERVVAALCVFGRSTLPLAGGTEPEELAQRSLDAEDLRSAADKWQALVASSGESIAIVDRTGQLLFTNAERHRPRAGRPVESVFSTIAPGSRPRLQAALEQVFKSGRSERCEVEYPEPRGASAWFEIRIVPIHRDGAVRHAILLGVEVTMRRRTEEALRESQRFIARVAETSPTILYVYDLTRLTYAYVNHQVSKILGFTTTDFLQKGRGFAESLVHLDDRPLLLERNRKLATVEDGTVVECVLRMHNSQGHWLYVRVREAIFTRMPDGRVEQIIGMAEDITQRQTARLELERSGKQLRALSAKLQAARETEAAAIARRVHDELGQNLTTLNTDLSFLAKDIFLLPAEEADPMLQKVRTMTETVATLLQTVRQLASELRPPVLDQFGLIAAVRWQAGEFQRRYGTRCEVTAKWRREIDDPEIATAVFRIFQEILTNIARHAAASKVSVTFQENLDDLALIVGDNGRGMTEGQQSESLGVLGMRERALLVGGSVEICGQAGKGTTVTVRIPRARLEPALMPRKESLLPERERSPKRR